MVTIRASHFALLLLVSVFLLGVSIAFFLDTDFKGVDVRRVQIADVNTQISGLLYQPIHATVANPLPAVVLVHGISGSKQMMSGIALELARRNVVALVIDLIGHGNSGGIFGEGDVDPTLGTLAAVRYLESQLFVKASLLGLVGHSLGAGAIRATAVAHGNIRASVYVGGGLGEMVSDPVYGVLNSTFPKNLLVAVGKHDILFDLAQLKDELLPVFAGAQEIETDRLYGNFSRQTARKLVTPTTTHVFEPMDPAIASESVRWMITALRSDPPLEQDAPSEIGLNYLYREAALSISLIAFVGLIFPISSIILDAFPSFAQERRSEAKYGILEDWKVLIIWGSLGLILFLPMFLLGFLIHIPPLIFGSSFAWWLLAVALIGLLLIRFLLPRFSTVRLNLKRAISEVCSCYDATMAIGIFLLLFSIVYVVEAIALVDLRLFVVPMFNDLKPLARIPMLLMFLPFFLAFFFVEGLYLHEFRNRQVQNHGLRSKVLAAGRTIGIKICPYLFVLSLQYLPMFLLDIRPLPSFLGFFLEFLWGFIPLFSISTACSWWFYRKTSAIGAGAILNSLLFAWSAAALFPRGALA